MIRRGEIRWFRFSSPDKRRPVVLLGCDEVLRSLGQVPVIPISTQVRGLSWEVPLSQADGLPAPCVLKAEWVQTVDRGLLGPWIADFPADRWPELRIALLRALGLEVPAATEAGRA